MRAPVRCKLRHVGAEQNDPSGIWSHVATDLIEQRGLAGAVRADDQAAFARSYRERYVLRYRKSAEGFVQIYDLERARGPRDPPRSLVINVVRPGTMPVGITSTMNKNTKPSSMFH